MRMQLAASPRVDSPNSNFVSARRIPAARRDRRPRSRYRARARSRIDLGDDPALSAERPCRAMCSTIASKSMFSSCSPCSAFVAGVKIGSGSRSLSRRPGGSADPADRAASPVLLPAGAGEVAADDRLDRARPSARSADHHPAAPLASVPIERRPGRRVVGRLGDRDDRDVDVEQVVRDDRRPSRRTRTATGRSARALVGDLGRQDDVEGADPVGRDEQQPAVGQRRTGRGPCPSGRTAQRSASGTSAVGRRRLGRSRRSCRAGR